VNLIYERNSYVQFSVLPILCECGKTAPYKGINKIKKIMVDENPSYMDEMIKITGEKTVPQIFIGDKHIGGFEQLRSMNNDGNLDKLILED